MNAVAEPVQPTAPVSQISFVLHGVAAAPVSPSRARLVSHATLEVAHYDIAAGTDRTPNSTRFDAALATVRRFRGTTNG